MKAVARALVLLLLLLMSTFPLFGKPADLAAEVQAFLASGAWSRALALLEQSPESQKDTNLKEMLAMAYLYTASNLDSMGNLEKAKLQMKQLVDQGGRARFLVSLARDKKKEAYLVEATPGELVVTREYVSFEARVGMAQKPVRWEKKDISECALNPKYGKDSNSFHLTVTQGRDKIEQHFRPLHFSADESNLVCSLIGLPQAPARR